MGLNRSMQMRWTTAPGNSQIVILWDSTRGPQGMSSTAVAAGSAFLVPGNLRGIYPRVIVAGTQRVTAQAVTLTFYRRTAFANAAADWELDSSAPGGGTVVVAAGTTQPYEWLAKEDSLLIATAGATGPTLFYNDQTVTITQDYGT